MRKWIITIIALMALIVLLLITTTPLSQDERVYAFQVDCPACGSVNDELDTNCDVCGEELHQTLENQVQYSISYYVDEVTPENLIGIELGGMAYVGEVVTEDDWDILNRYLPEGYLPAFDSTFLLVTEDEAQNLVRVVYRTSYEI